MSSALTSMKLVLASRLKEWSKSSMPVMVPSARRSTNTSRQDKTRHFTCLADQAVTSIPIEPQKYYPTSGVHFFLPTLSFVRLKGKITKERGY